MHKLKLFAVYYKSTLTISLAFALTVGVMGSMLGFLPAFGVAFMTGGWVVSLFYKETVHKNEYVYYQNMGLTKSSLIMGCALLNCFAGLMCIWYGYA